MYSRKCYVALEGRGGSFRFAFVNSSVIAVAPEFFRRDE
jgi:hypothetical protein